MESKLKPHNPLIMKVKELSGSLKIIIMTPRVKLFRSRLKENEKPRDLYLNVVKDFIVSKLTSLSKLIGYRFYRRCLRVAELHHYFSFIEAFEMKNRVWWKTVELCTPKIALRVLFIKTPLKIIILKNDLVKLNTTLRSVRKLLLKWQPGKF